MKPPSMENGPESKNTPTVPTTFTTSATIASHAVLSREHALCHHAHCVGKPGERHNEAPHGD